MLIPDIIVNLKLVPTNEGGRTMPTPENFFGCIFDVHGSNHDGRLLLENVGSINPGELKQNVPVKFLCPDLVMAKIKVKDRLILKEGHIIGEAIITKILNKNPESTHLS